MMLVADLWLVEAKNNENEWVSLFSINSSMFHDKKMDEWFTINPDNENIVMELKDSPIRLKTLEIGGITEEPIQYYVVEFGSWTFDKGRVRALKQRNILRYTEPITE
jgi:hypothetical protein